MSCSGGLESSLSQPSSASTPPAVAEKPAQMNNGTKEEFSSSVRREMAKEHKEHGSLSGLEVSRVKEEELGGA